ncbi:hypothetical protein PG993_013660 [Apiospora rasikravindrae]|uniref:Uncharacterized protein n=1 Tax=Apiospora rasikravindrae TaxID=990691 RepID=A0ABR1RQU1_9PEZI
MLTDYCECADSYLSKERKESRVGHYKWFDGLNETHLGMWLENPVDQLFTPYSHHRCREKTCGATAVLASNSKYSEVHIGKATAFCHEGSARSGRNKLSRLLRRARLPSLGLRGARGSRRRDRTRRSARTARAWATTAYRRHCPKYACSVEDCGESSADEGLGAVLGYCLNNVTALVKIGLGDFQEPLRMARR